jgi:biopolymer transport protein ExbD
MIGGRAFTKTLLEDLYTQLQQQCESVQIIVQADKTVEHRVIVDIGDAIKSVDPAIDLAVRTIY